MKIAIRVDGSKELGMGNIFRSLTLADELKSNGQDVSFIVKSYVDAYETIQKKDFPVFLVNANSINGSLTAQVCSIIDSYGFQMVINDIKNTDTCYMKELKSRNLIVVNFDDLGTGRNLADFLFDAFLISNSQNNKPGHNFGPKFMILRNEFNSKNNKRIIPRNVNVITVIMGAANTGDLLDKVLKAISLLPDRIQFNIILSKAVTNAEIYQLNYSKPNFTFHYHPHNISELFSKSDLVITAGGISMCEACSQGTPTLVIPQMPHEETNAKHFETLGAVETFSYNPEISLDNIHDKVLELINNHSKRVSLSSNGMKLIDGNGLNRILEVLTPHLAVN
ncbi:MAG: glycosyltransferase 28-like protein [uncultured bacterium]|nr:MAG: glycosyltransferase 28-like protein [uncultured bacterium]